MLNIPVRISDGEAESNLFILSVAVIPVNKIPVAANQTVTCDEDTDTVITLVGTDVDPEEILSYLISRIPANGALYQTVDGTTRGSLIRTAPAAVSSETRQVIYAPAQDGNGIGHGNFGFRANDSKADSK